MLGNNWKEKVITGDESLRKRRKQNANPWGGKEKMNQEQRNPDFARNAERQLPGESSSLVWTSVERFYSHPVLIAELNQLTKKFHAEVESGSLAIDVGLRWASPSRIAVCILCLSNAGQIKRR
ncbi:hypothetical protein LAZ67_17001897 [Cordylochernes scorpioides]|uniref:Uncharacterized protein n=1 Tax=Cordylochernes scorpioides TaxID=51811 RepID=A0ABY6LDM7_9ARAC|nr:hypothetical protein LAZ67_17001897 [Cordylochernes scorpioides]